MYSDVHCTLYSDVQCINIRCVVSERATQFDSHFERATDLRDSQFGSVRCSVASELTWAPAQYELRGLLGHRESGLRAPALTHFGACPQKGKGIKHINMNRHTVCYIVKIIR